MPANSTPIAVDVTANTDGLKQALDGAGQLGERFAGRLVSAFAQIANGSKSVDETLKGLALSLSKLALGEALKPLQSAFSSSVGSLFSGLTNSLLSSATGAAASPLARGASAPARGVNVNFQVTSPDVAGFKRSETQVTAMLSRAIGNAQRNL